MEPLGIALLGCGTVGGGVAKLLLQHAERMTRRAGRPLQLKRVVVRDTRGRRAVPIPPDLITTDARLSWNDPKVDIVVELIGGTTLARDYVLQSLAAGKHVVTANKALLAEHGIEIFETARHYDRCVCFEASVAGGVPIIGAIAQSMSANQITGIQGILNGTSNFILTQMSEANRKYDDALKEAQKLGYAEADPTLDVNGLDAAHKLAILVQIAFGITVPVHQIERIGISSVETMDLRFAKELGYTIKLLAEAWLDSGEVALHVAPVLLRQTDMLAQVRGAFNAIQVIGDVVGDTLYQGPGAGAMPTASAVVSDLIDLAVGRAQSTFQAAKLWTREGKGFSLRTPEGVRTRFYLRVLVADKPGMLADVARVLAEHQISIASVIQHEALEEHQGDIVPLVIMTHYAPTGSFWRAIKQINSLQGVLPPAVYYSVDD
jgi:homoserine dehydrogenase